MSSPASVCVSLQVESNIEEAAEGPYEDCNLIAPKWDESPQEQSSLQIKYTNEASLAVLIVNQIDQEQHLISLSPLRRLRTAVHSVVALRRLQITLPRARRLSLLKKCAAGRKWEEKGLLHLLRSTSFVLLFVTTLSCKIKRNYANCAPLNEVLELVTAASNLNLVDSMLINAGKCRVLVQILSPVGTYLGMFKFILDTISPTERYRSSAGLSDCYYVLKEMCRLLRQCLQYIDGCSGANRSHKLYTKLQSISTIKLLISDINACLQLLVTKVDEFIGDISYSSGLIGAVSYQAPTPIKFDFTAGRFLEFYLQLQAEQDLSDDLSKLKQFSELPFFILRWTHRAEVSDWVRLLIARLEYDHKKLTAGEDEIHALEHGLRVDSKYVKVVKFIGAGSYGKVEEVECFGQRYAMKTIMSNGLENAKEAAIQARLEHPHIVKLIWYTINNDLNDTQDRISLLMELMDMGLDNYLAHRVHLKRAPLSKCPMLAVHLMLQIAEAMKYLHSHGIMHRDLKASNVLVDLSCSPDFIREGYFTVKLCDFGLAKVKEAAGAQQDSGLNTAKVGTQYWRAPEVVALGDDTDMATYSFSADVYSYAMTCYEILTGETPFRNHKTASHASLMMHRIVSLHERPSLPEDDMHPRLVRIIKQCWDGTPDARPSFHTICLELQHVKRELIFRPRN